MSAPVRSNSVEHVSGRHQAFPSSGHMRRRCGHVRRVIAPALIACLGAILAACGGAPSSSVSSNPPPELFRWDEPATMTAQMPQTAYTAAMNLTPCLGAPGSSSFMGAPPSSSSVTWFVTTPNYGLADIQVTCVPPAKPFHLMLIQLYHNDPNGGWRLMGGAMVGKNGIPSAASAPPPSWLPLPGDTYVRYDVEYPGPHESPAASVVAWDGQTQLFVLGHVADRAVQPGDATPVNVDGHPGWMTSENGLVTVTEALPDGTTRFFAGTASPVRMQTLAEGAFAHSADVLQPL